MFSRVVERNLLTEEQNKYIINYINNKLNTLEIKSFSEQEMMKKPNFDNILIIEEALGRIRYQIPTHELSKDIIDHLHKIAHKYNKDLKLQSSTFARYSAKYGKPKLPPHMDKHDNNFTMFYQVSANIQWPLFVQQEFEVLNNNDAFLLNTKNTIHWRLPQVFQDGDYVDMIFFHFADGSKSMLTVQDRYDICEPWKPIYHRLMIEKYGYDIYS